MLNYTFNFCNVYIYPQYTDLFRKKQTVSLYSLLLLGTNLKSFKNISNKSASVPDIKLGGVMRITWKYFLLCGIHSVH